MTTYRIAPAGGVVALQAESSTRVSSVFLPGDNNGKLTGVFIGTDRVWFERAWGGENVCSPGVCLAILVTDDCFIVEVDADSQVDMTLMTGRAVEG